MSQPSDAREEFEKILNQDEYQAYNENAEGPFQKWREAVGEWFNNLIESLFPNASINSPGAEGLLYFFGIIGVGLLIFLIVRLSKATNNQAELKKRNPIAHSSQLGWSYQQHLEESERLESRGETQEAVRHLFLALLLYFDEQEWISAQVWKSNGDYYEELQKVKRSVAKDFQDAALLFERVVYGKQAINQTHYQAFRQKVTTLINLSHGKVGS
ncbi:DUF4129 domain-containing protein [Halobacillus locisalis]|uniref:DUF4129 domain-containing protein n=1 Tax=Halobacillus locisalis TaxID=220753 RepID=A0A838CSN9_9BACI|nr:DUF4129 domain-containing protein [Halobacillus locisalis]MBA2174971.1 DUF4129 domain-containing protein [Halobacillus locisalis]